MSGGDHLQKPFPIAVSRPTRTFATRWTPFLFAKILHPPLLIVQPPAMLGAEIRKKSDSELQIVQLYRCAVRSNLHSSMGPYILLGVVRRP